MMLGVPHPSQQNLGHGKIEAEKRLCRNFAGLFGDSVVQIKDAVHGISSVVTNELDCSRPLRSPLKFYTVKAFVWAAWQIIKLRMGHIHQASEVSQASFEWFHVTIVPDL